VVKQILRILKEKAFLREDMRLIGQQGKSLITTTPASPGRTASSAGSKSAISPVTKTITTASKCSTKAQVKSTAVDPKPKESNDETGQHNWVMS